MKSLKDDDVGAASVKRTSPTGQSRKTVQNFAREFITLIPDIVDDDDSELSLTDLWCSHGQ